MIKSIKKTIETNELESITCDVCQREVLANDWEESQEFLTIRMRGGFGSIFGDGAKVESDICQHCVQTLLGAYLRIEDEA